MKKFMLVPIFFFNVSCGMDKQMSEEMQAERALFEAFRAKCSALTVFEKEDCYADKIDTNPDEVCAAIQTLSPEARGLRREIYENQLKLLVSEQARAQSEEYRNVVQQLATLAVYRKGPRSAIYALVCKAVDMKMRQYELQCVAFERENKQLKAESNTTMSLALAFAAGLLAAKVTSNLLG